MTKLIIKTCPICGSNRIRLVKRDIKGNRNGHPYIARGIEIEECPNCGERLFSPEALDAIDAQIAPAKRAKQRKSA